MTARRWDPTLATGHPTIDEQHHELFDLVAELEDGASGVLAVLERIMEHVDVHFAMEEALMSERAYPEPARGEHVEDHERLRNRAREIVLALREDRPVASGQVADYLSEWLIAHTNTRDRALVGFLRATADADAAGA